MAGKGRGGLKDNWGWGLTRRPILGAHTLFSQPRVSAVRRGGRGSEGRGFLSRPGHLGLAGGTTAVEETKRRRNAQSCGQFNLRTSFINLNGREPPPPGV